MIPKSKPPERLMAEIPGLERFPPNIKAFLEVLANAIAEDVMRNFQEGRVDLNKLDRRCREDRPAVKVDKPEQRPRILDIEEVMDLTGLSEAEISRLEGNGWFPPSRTSSRQSVWMKHEVDEWVTLWQRRVPIPTRLRVRVKKPPLDPSKTPRVPRIVRVPLLGVPRRVKRASRRS